MVLLDLCQCEHCSKITIFFPKEHSIHASAVIFRQTCLLLSIIHQLKQKSAKRSILCKNCIKVQTFSGISCLDFSFITFKFWTFNQYQHCRQIQSLLYKGIKVSFQHCIELISIGDEPVAQLSRPKNGTRTCVNLKVKSSWLELSSWGCFWGILIL